MLRDATLAAQPQLPPPHPAPARLRLVSHYALLPPSTAAMQWLTLFNNTLSGTLPSWSNLNSTEVGVKPGNDGLCGAVSDGLEGCLGMLGAVT